MMQSDRMTLGRTAKNLGVVRDTLEKVCRLADVLKFMENDSLLNESLALKGGTAINLTIFNLPRLSVDIDLDYSRHIEREKMLSDRIVITEKISKYMKANGYNLSPRSKSYHALDSFVYEYTNAGGTKDNLKIEINYMLRSHVLSLSHRNVILPWNQEKFSVFSVAPLEIYASKITALLTRTAPRDLYDVHNMIKYRLFDDKEEEMLRKCTVFYSAIASETPPADFDFSKLGKITRNQIMRDLWPVLRKNEKFDLVSVQKEVEEYLSSLLVPTDDEREFWNQFRERKYCPELIFGESEETNRIKNHPMALWKCREN